MFNTNKEVKDDICRSRFALFINNIKRDIKRRRHHYREPSRIPIKALKALKHCGFVDKEKQNNDGYTRSMEINKATFMHHAKMPAGHLVSIKSPLFKERNFFENKSSRAKASTDWSSDGRGGEGRGRVGSSLRTASHMDSSIPHLGAISNPQANKALVL